MSTKTAETQRPRATPDIEDAIEAALERRMRDGQTGYIPEQDELAWTLRRLIDLVAEPLVESGSQTLDDGRGIWEPVPEPREGTVWVDLRPSEAGRLTDLVRAACERAASTCEAAILDEPLAAGLAFAREFPEVPRATG